MLLARGSLYLVAGLRASGLHGGETVVVSGNGVVVLDALLGAALLVDFHQGERGRVVLHQPHLRRHRHHSGHCRREERRRQVRGNMWQKKKQNRTVNREITK